MQEFYSHVENYAQDMFIRKVFYYTLNLQTDEEKKKILSSVCLERYNVLAITSTENSLQVFDQCMTHEKLEGKFLPSDYLLEGREEGAEDLREIKQSHPFKYSIFTSEERKGILSNLSFGMLETSEEWR